MKRNDEEYINYTSEKQGELFAEFQGAKVKKAGHSLRSNMMFGKKVILALSYENIVLLLIGFIMLLVIFFSLGVEKGKAIVADVPETAEKQRPETEKNEAAIPETPEMEPVENPEIAEGGKSAEEGVIDAALKPYTIQVASFKNEKDAKKEIERLKDDDCEAFAIRSNNWLQVCVGRYANKKESGKDFEILKNRYPTCYFRKIEE